MSGMDEATIRDEAIGPVSAKVHVIRADGKQEWFPATARERGGRWWVSADDDVPMSNGDEMEWVVYWPETGSDDYAASRLEQPQHGLSGRAEQNPHPSEERQGR